MKKSNCLRTHYPESICMAEKVVFFHGTRFRIALSVHEFYCDKCNKVRHLWFINGLKILTCKEFLQVEEFRGEERWKKKYWFMEP